MNVSPDSFSADGAAAEAAIARGKALAAAGADILDIGGESTRPGAQPIALQEEMRRVAPVIAALAHVGIPISIDTMKPEVARAAVTVGAAFWNDVTALSYAPASPQIAAELKCAVILMHMRGEPRAMQASPRYDDVVSEVVAFLEARAEIATRAGVARERIWLDPGIGFGKTAAHNLALMKALPRLVALGFPVMLGVSRKGFIRGIDASAREPGDRLGGSLATALAGARAGVAAVRVHDVRETVQALEVDAALRSGGDA